MAKSDSVQIVTSSGLVVATIYGSSIRNTISLTSREMRSLPATVLSASSAFARRPGSRALLLRKEANRRAATWGLTASISRT